MTDELTTPGEIEDMRRLLSSMEAELRRTEEQLRQAQRIEPIALLAGGLAHDLNNVLSVILVYAALVLDLMRPEDPSRGYVEEMRCAGNRAAALTRQLLAFTRQRTPEPRSLDLGTLVAEMESMLRRLLAPNIELSVLTSPCLGKADVDPSQLEQVVMNLVVNARDAMPRGGKLTLEVADAELDAAYASCHPGLVPGPYVLIAVSDTGFGIDAAARQHIFEPFFTTKPIGKGTGLGLSTVLGIVTQSRGHVAVCSRPGGGTTFEVYFPRSDHTSASETCALRTSRPPGGSETILVVEDDEHVRGATCAVLERYGYRVLDAQNAGEAFLICEQFPGSIHLLLSDVVLPRMSGPALASRLLAMRHEMRVLYVSGYMGDPVACQGVLSAGLAVLQKPFTPGTLLSQVREVLDACG